MIEMPKKIWAGSLRSSYGWTSIEEQVFPDDKAYIRADLVDELVEATKELTLTLDLDKDVKEKNWWFEVRAKARAALAKLEESHD